MTERMEKFFDPCVKLTRRGGIFMLNEVSQFDLVAQLKLEAKIRGSINDRNYDDFLKAASAHGYSVEVEDMETV